MSVLQETVSLNTGAAIPRVGLGTWQMPDTEVTEAAVSAALSSGVRLIDTAAAYGNERSVGRAIRASGLPREELFVVTKLPAEIKGYDETHHAFEQSLEALGLDYVDLYLIHAPWPWDQVGADCTEGNVASWRAMEEMYRDGRARAIGVSNFARQHLQPILDRGSVVPAVNQLAYFIGYREQESADFARQNGLHLMAYSPLGTGRVFRQPELPAIAEKYGVTVAQLCIRWCLQHGATVIPKSTHPQRIRENIALDFVISDDDMRLLDTL